MMGRVTMIQSFPTPPPPAGTRNPLGAGPRGFRWGSVAECCGDLGGVVDDGGEDEAEEGDDGPALGPLPAGRHSVTTGR